LHSCAPTALVPRSHLERKYGLTLEAFDEMLASQGRGCAICGNPKADNVDHDHATGRVRGILCFNCNVAIGHVAEDSERARAVADYLERDDELTAVARARGLALAG
jgi:Recombination endonuclease VII